MERVMCMFLCLKFGTPICCPEESQSVALCDESNCFAYSCLIFSPLIIYKEGSGAAGRDGRCFCSLVSSPSIRAFSGDAWHCLHVFSTRRVIKGHFVISLSRRFWMCYVRSATLLKRNEQQCFFLLTIVLFHGSS